MVFLVVTSSQSYFKVSVRRQDPFYELIQSLHPRQKNHTIEVRLAIPPTRKKLEDIQESVN